MAAIVVVSLLSLAASTAAPAMLGMKTGFPLYVVGSSTFGTAGGYVMPGLLMGLLQVGWFAVNTAISTQFILNTIGSKAGPGSLPFIAIGILWGYGMAYIGVMGIQYVAKLSRYLIIIPAGMVLLVFFRTSSRHQPVRSRRPAPLHRVHAAGADHYRILRHGGRGRRGFRNEQPQ